jgi:hypothetical protein
MRAHERLLVDDRAARNVDERTPGAERREDLGVHGVLRVGRRGGGRDEDIDRPARPTDVSWSA